MRAGLYCRIKYNQTRQTRVMNQIISDRGAVGEIIYPREKDKSAQKKNELQIRRNYSRTRGIRAIGCLDNTDSPVIDTDSRQFGMSNTRRVIKGIHACRRA